jgi:hypothetical protein
MTNTKTLALNGRKAIALTQFIVFVLIATFAPLLKQQMLTGPLVNTTLFLSTIYLGSQAGIMVGLIPSVISLSIGLLPLALTPMVPFIMVSNAILILTFAYLKNKNFWFAVITASILKFAFLYTTSFHLAPKLAFMMGLPQLVTALVGGAIAFSIAKFYDH